MADLKTLLKTYFETLTQDDLDIIMPYFHEEVLEKNAFFCRSEQRCNRLSFIQSGILRIYGVSDGREVTQWLGTENYLITDVQGFFFDTSSRWSIQAFSTTELLTISKTDYRKLCVAFPKWNEIEKQLILKCFSLLENRVFSHLSMSAKDRYAVYFEQNKELFNQVSLHYIASVLGMSPETFSRIRREFQ